MSQICGSVESAGSGDRRQRGRRGSGGVYEQTIQMAAEGREVVSFISFLRSPNFALAALPERVKSVADLRGKMLGVTSPGSPSQFYLNRILKSAGLRTTDA